MKEDALPIDSWLENFIRRFVLLESQERCLRSFERGNYTVLGAFESRLDARLGRVASRRSLVRSRGEERGRFYSHGECRDASLQEAVDACEERFADGLMLFAAGQSGVFISHDGVVVVCESAEELG